MALSPSQPQARIQLSAEEMRAISLEISRGFAPRRFKAGSVRKARPGFSPQELLSVSQQISREFAPRAENNRPAKLVALPVDPEHLHVYWQLDEVAPQSAPGVAAEPVETPQPLILRVFSDAACNAPAQPKSGPVWFDVPVDGNRNQQQITLPSGDVCMAGQYRVAIGRLNQQQAFTALVSSNTASTPPQASVAKESLSPVMVQFIMPPSQASSVLAVNPSGQN